MKKLFVIFVLGAASGAGGYWFFQQQQPRGRLAEAKDRLMFTAWKAGKSLKEAADEIKAELAKTGIVVRDKAKTATQAVSLTVSDTAIAANVKGKLLAEPGLRSVGVETTQGVVTLTGTVESHEDIARAMKLALEPDGADRVVSKLQLNAAKPTPPTAR